MTNDEIGYNVKVENACKSYDGKIPVLRNLNINVASGSIYALLGPSGCGKSTLLQCILGTMKLDSGCIDLKTKHIKDIGYMPQHLCLDETLTIKETIEYFGSLYNMSVEQIKSRTIELDKFLQLPNMNELIKNISGGQSKRVSLAISLLHDPKFIILDEPTVGIDPLMRYEIWKEFTRMVKQCHKTIIVTTHYVEEANQANCIGFMKRGRIITEGSPQSILAKYQSDTLESCFMIAYSRNENNEITRERNENIETEVVTKQTSLAERQNNISLYRIKAMIKKNCRVCFRDYIIIYSTVFLPILQSLIYCYSIGVNFENMPIAIKNDEVDFKSCQHFNLNECIFDDEDNDQPLSCVVVNHLQSLDYDLFEVEDREAGEISMTNLESRAFLYFPKNYTKEFGKYFDDHEHFDVKKLNYAHINKDNFLITNQVTTDILDATKDLIEKALALCSNNPKNYPISFDYTSVFGDEVKSNGNSIISFFIALSAFYFSSMFAVSTIMSEKMDGYLSRSVYAGVKISEMVIAILCVCTILNLIQLSINFVITFVVFHYPIIVTTDGMILYFLLSIILGWNGFFFGLLAAVTTPTQIGGIYFITGLSMTQLLSIGAIWPLEGQPKLLQTLSEFLPVRIGGKILTNIALKGWTFDNPSVIFGTTTMISYIIIIILALIVVGKYKKDLWIIQK